MTPERWQQVREVLHQALELAPDRRPSFLEQACSTDHSLRREVESLLESADEAHSDFLPSSVVRVTLAKGTRLGDYEILALIGSGGMGDVYRAFDANLQRTVAVKLLADSGADPIARGRFQREAQLCSALNHPHILTVLDAGEHEGRQYLVTEFVDGGTLRDWASAAPRTWRQSLDLLIGVADALAMAHEAGILHRDVKLENILITKRGYAKLLTSASPGMARAAGRWRRDVACTRGDDRRHRPTCRPSRRSASRPTRGARLSFGTVLRERRRPPFGGATEGDPQERRQRRHRAAARDGTASAQAIVRKALEPDPANRYQAMREMVVDLRRLVRPLDDQSALTRRRRERGRGPRRRLRRSRSPAGYGCGGVRQNGWLPPIAGRN
jgi:serine/threonine protein kinase